MRKAKKLLSLALAAMMFVSAFSSTAFASDMDDAMRLTAWMGNMRSCVGG